MNEKRILIVGASGHAKVVADALIAIDSRAVVQFADRDRTKCGKSFLGFNVVELRLDEKPDCGSFHIAIGDNCIREELAAIFDRQWGIYRAIMHPRAYMAVSSRLDEGVFVAANAIIGPDTHIERGSIVNHGAVVDHDCRVGSYCHVAPNATLAGGVRLGARVLVGAGANILPGVRIGDDSVIGAGAVVLHDVPASSVYVGVPARNSTGTNS